MADGPGKALVLAAGLGTRLRPLSEELPKPAWPLFDVPLAGHVLAALAGAGVEDAVVNLHHLPALLREHLTPWTPRGMRVRWSPEERILGTGGALAPWREHFGDAPFWVANADTHQQLDLEAMVRVHQEMGALATLSVRPVAVGAPAPLEVDERGRLVRLLDARAPGARPGRPCDFSGVHLLQPEILRHLPAGPSCIVTDLHLPLLRRGAPLRGFVPLPGAFWSDLGTPPRYAEGHRALLERGEVPSLAPGRAVLDDPLALPGGAIVLAPSYLGPGAVLGEGARVGPYAVVGRGAQVGEGARVERAVLWPGAEVRAGETACGEIRSGSGTRIPVDQPNATHPRMGT